MATGISPRELRNAHLKYSYRPRGPCSGAAYATVTVIDPPCPDDCAGLGPGLVYQTRVFHTDTCAFDAPVCALAADCPLPDCP